MYVNTPDDMPVIYEARPVAHDAVVMEKSPVSKFLVDEVYDGDVVIKHYGTDVGILLSQDRLSRELGPVLDSIVSNVRSGDLSDKYAGLSDDDLIRTVKSRYIQAPCEVRDWSAYLMSELDALEVFPTEPTSEPASEPTSEPASEPSSEPLTE